MKGFEVRNYKKILVLVVVSVLFCLIINFDGNNYANCSKFIIQTQSSNYTSIVTPKPGDYVPPSQALNPGYNSNYTKVIVDTPVISPNGGTYFSSQSVKISCSTQGATIRYTTDGSIPAYNTGKEFSSTSPPIQVTTNTTIKAGGFKQDYVDSSTAIATYNIIISKVATPAFSPVGKTYSSVQSVIISCTTAGVNIRYTTNGDNPTPSSTQYSGPITVSSTSTLKAKAFKTGMTESDTATSLYTIVPKIVTPVFSPPEGTYSRVQSVIISCTTAGVNIRYTTNGDNPTPSSTQYSGPITVSSTSTLKAKAFKTGMTESDTATSLYTIVPKIVTPVFSPPEGTYSRVQSVIISCTTAGVNIRYTTNGDNPTPSSTQYSGPITVSSTSTLKAKAFKTGMTESDTATSMYTIDTTPLEKVSAPSMTPSDGTYYSVQSISLGSSTAGATIRYTIDGSEPGSSSTVYSGPITLSSTTTIKAKAFAGGMTDSDTAMATYTFSGATSTITPTTQPTKTQTPTPTTSPSTTPAIPELTTLTTFSLVTILTLSAVILKKKRT